MAKKVTAHNTGLSIARKGNKFTASWKIAAKEVSSQEGRYRIHNGKKWGAWTKKSLGKKTTSFSFTLSAADPVTQIQVQTRILRNPTAEWAVSDWSTSSATFAVQAPPAPSLEISSESANSTTFTITDNSSGTGKKWCRRLEYRTKCTNTPVSADDWTAWAAASNETYTYSADMTSGTTRFFQVKAVGPGGESSVKTEQHYIGAPPAAAWGDPPVTYKEHESYVEMTYSAILSGSEYQIDEIVPQYYIGEPAEDMSPGSTTFNDGTSYSYKESGNYALAINTEEPVGLDKCLWAKIKTLHDGIPAESEVYRVLAGELTPPTAAISIGTPTASGFTVTITNINARTTVPDTYMQVYLEKSSAAGTLKLIGTIQNGAASATINCDDDITGEIGCAIYLRNVTADGESMKSAFLVHPTQDMPSAPTDLAVQPTAASGKVYVSWTNNCAGANGTEIAWTDDPDNWMSNEEPDTYLINEVVSGWYITGLEPGRTWYFRVRSAEISDDDTIYTPWSEQYAIDLASAPAVPVLYLSEDVITEDGTVTAYWSYVTTDGTSQVSGNVVEAAYYNGEWIYGDPVDGGTVTDAQHADISAKNNGWSNGDVVYLALQTRSKSGGVSEYSTPVKLMIAAKPTVSITSTSLSASGSRTEYFEGDGTTRIFDVAKNPSARPTAKVDGVTVTVSSYSGSTVTLASAPAAGKEVAITYTTAEDKILTALPMTVTVEAENAETVYLAIERAVDYPVLRPDGDVTDGHAEETICLMEDKAAASNSFSIDLSDLTGRLDDGAYYELVVTAADAYGQTDEDRVPFIVHWAHQAWEPTATFITDEDEYIVRISPVAGADYASGDKCDIYRLGADKPELIYSGAEFGTEYVDPYPAFGESSGYKVVTVTKNGDYITADGSFADYDTTIEEDGAFTQLDPKMMVIDFGGDRVELPYNITLGNTWKKDFERTAYLGGHVAGDHNRTVLRDTSLGTVLIRKVDETIARKMRSLARYAGICHVRTPEGSSFAADVQVGEDRAFDSALIEYSLTVQKVDTVGFDGMTYAEWSEMQ